jgi:hypothetical protein
MTKITKLSIFDLDGTLINTPLPDVGKKIYEEKTGSVWPHVGWWGRHESLDMDIFDMPVVEAVVADYIKQMADTEAAVVMLTGRMIGLADKVKAILDAKKLVFDDYHYNKGGATEVSKVKSMERLLQKYADVTEIEMWDDRDLHIPIFQAFGDKLVASGRLSSFKVNHVITGHHDSINND